jgi:hypothetical protein
MDAQNHNHANSLEEFEGKADELISLMFALCEERLREIAAIRDARASSLAHAAMAVRDALQTFLALQRIR